MTGFRLRIEMVSMMLVLGGTILYPAEPAHASGELWVARYDRVGDVDEVNAMVVSPDGSKVFVTGDSIDHGAGYDVATLAYDTATGAPLWLSRYDDPGNDYDQGRALAVSPDGSKLFVTGVTGGQEHTTAASYLTIGLDATTGALLWSRRYEGPAGMEDVARAIAVSPDGSKVFVTGDSRGSPYRPDWATLAYDAATGARLWLKRLGGPGHGGAANALAVTPDGTKVLVTGSNTTNGSSSDYVTVAYDPVTGSRLWTSIYDGPGHSNDDPTSIAVSPDGSHVVVTGSSYKFSLFDEDFATVAYDTATGSELWAERYDGPGSLDDVANAIAVTGDGSRVFVAGSSSGADGTNDYATLGYDSATGSPLWLRRFEAPVQYSDNIATAVGSTPDGSMAFVSGRSWGQGDYNYVTIAYDGVTGIPLGIRSYDAGLNRDEQACCLAVAPDGSKVFVSGYGNGVGTNRDYLTVAYAVSGP